MKNQQDHHAVSRLERPQVVVIGAGFGGLEAAKRLSELRVAVTIIDRRNYHLFQPLLYQVATGGLNPGDIAEPVRSILRDRDVEVVLGDVVAIDNDEDHVQLADGRVYPFDYLVVATGMQTSYFGHPEWAVSAPGLKSIEDATEIRRRVLSAFELADRTDDDAERRRSLTFVVVGAGATGVEMAGAIAEVAKHGMARSFRSFDASQARIFLLDAGSRVLPSFHPSLSRTALRQLNGLGVTTVLGAAVTGVDEQGVDMERSGEADRIEANTVVWAAGVSGSPIGRLVSDDLDRQGRVIVDQHLAVPGRPNVFVIGDLARFDQDGAAIPAVAPAAIQGAQHVASTVSADLDGRTRPRFHYVDKGSMATVGHSAAVMEIGRLRAGGFVAWVAWWALHIALIVEFRSRMLVMFGWGWSWLTRRRGVGIITRPWSPDVE
ncbi:MAG: NAD(P)/FAD-dependent oxidoreductase [Acidimicrobiia bacterium]|nr:NAD(P)/FAD-dependent oxidoreductase [Acidimicrobiia bacterium]